MTHKTLYLALAFVSIALSSVAQSARQRYIDSLKMAALSDYATRYPILRQGALTTDFIAGKNTTGELNGKPLYNGDMNITRVRSFFRLPLAEWGKNAISGTLSYQQMHFETKDISSYDPAFPAADRNLTKAAVGFTATFSRSDSLFHYPISYSASISGLTDDATAIKRINYTGTVNVPISRSATSAWSVGVAVVLDPSSVAPVVPFVSYWHHFKSSDFDLYVDMPSRIALRKQLSKKSWVFLGSELGGNLYFFNQHDLYSGIDIRSGATLEYLLSKKLVFGLSGGLYTTAQSRIFDRSAKPDTYFFRTSNGSAPYLSVSLSFLPFLKKL